MFMPDRTIVCLTHVFTNDLLGKKWSLCMLLYPQLLPSYLFLVSQSVVTLLELHTEPRLYSNDLYTLNLPLAEYYFPPDYPLSLFCFIILGKANPYLFNVMVLWQGLNWAMKCFEKGKARYLLKRTKNPQALETKSKLHDSLTEDIDLETAETLWLTNWRHW